MSHKYTSEVIVCKSIDETNKDYFKSQIDEILAAKEKAVKDLKFVCPVDECLVFIFDEAVV